jgi:hypothetical protein
LPDIGRVFNYIDVARNLILPVNDSLLTHDGGKNLLFEALDELRVGCDVFNYEEHIIINRVLVLLGELPVKGQLQKALVGHVFEGLVELDHRLVHQQLSGVLHDDVLREGEGLEGGVIEDDLLPAVVEDRDLALILLIEVSLHVHNEEYGLASLPYLSIIGVSFDLVHDEFYKTHMLLICDVVCVKDKYDLCLGIIELMQLLYDFLL